MKCEVCCINEATEVYADRDFPSSSNYCKRCADNTDAYPFWLVHFKYTAYLEDPNGCAHNQWTEDALVYWGGRFVPYKTIHSKYLELKEKNEKK